MTKYKDWHTKVSIDATRDVVRVLKKKYPKEYQDLLDKHRALAKSGEHTTNYVSRARANLRLNHEKEFQELYTIEVAKHGVKSVYQRRLDNINKIQKLINISDPTKPIRVRTY